MVQSARKVGRTQLWLKNSTAFTVILSSLALGSAVIAQDAKAQTARPRAAADTSVEEVLVTARRREESLQNAPVAVAALTGGQLSKYAITGIGDLSKFVPGMVVGRQVTGGSASIFLRGSVRR